MINDPEQGMEHIKKQFIEKIADNMKTFGVSSTVGRMLGIIYMNRKPMTLDELSEATGMSKMRMSQVIREMIELNIAEQVFEKGVRKNLYNVESDYHETFIALFTSNWRKAVSKSRMFESNLSKQLAMLEKADNEKLSVATEETLNELLKETSLWLEYYDWISRLIDFFETGEVFKHVPK